MDQSFMSEFKTKKQLKGFILESLEEIVELLRTLDHPTRLMILAKMLDKEEISFGELLDDIGSQKSALANHLSLLTERNLLTKPEKGVYRITFEGEILLERLARSHLEAKLREQERLMLLLRKIGKASPYIMRVIEPMNPETNELIKIVKLPQSRAISFHALAKGLGVPEPLAWQKLLEWGKPRGILDQPQKFQIFGFNNPCPPEINETTEYGYELLVTIPHDYEVDDKNLTIKDFRGGLYGVMTCKGIPNISPTWKELVNTLKKSKYKLECKNQWLERFVNPLCKDENDVILDLYAPIISDLE